MKKTIYVIKKIVKITTIFVIFILAAFAALILPAATQTYIMYILSLPFGVAVYIAVIKITDWNELFDFYDYDHLD